MLLTGNLQAQNFSLLFDFSDSGNGEQPVDPLIQGPDGRLYGTAPTGCNLLGVIVFAINTDGPGYTNFWTFSGSVGEGSQPNDGLLLSGNAFYGTTAQSKQEEPESGAETHSSSQELGEKESKE